MGRPPRRKKKNIYVADILPTVQEYSDAAVDGGGRMGDSGAKRGCCQVKKNPVIDGVWLDSVEPSFFDVVGADGEKQETVGK